MNPFDDPRVTAFVGAVRRFRDVLEKRDLDHGEARHELLSSLSQMVASIYSWPPEFSTMPENVDDVRASEFEIGEDAVERVRSRMQEQLGEDDAFRMHWEPLRSERDAEADESEVSRELASVYDFVIPPLRAWDTGAASLREYALYAWRSGGLCWMHDVGGVFHALTKLAGPPPC